MAFHERKEEKPEKKLKKVPEKKPNDDNLVHTDEINQKVDGKIQKVEENILQWIDEEAKTLKESLEKDILEIRKEVDTKNIDLNSKVQTSLHDLKEEMNQRISGSDPKPTDDSMFDSNDIEEFLNNGFDESAGAMRAILDLKNKLHRNCNTLRFLCSEPLSVQFSIWHKGELEMGRDGENQLVTFNWVNSNVGGAVIDGKAVINHHFSLSSKIMIEYRFLVSREWIICVTGSADKFNCLLFCQL